MFAMPWVSGSAPDTTVSAPGQRECAAAATIELLTVNQVAAMLRVSKMTVYRLIRAGTLHAVRIEGSLQLHRDSVDTFVHIATRMRSGN